MLPVVDPVLELPVLDPVELIEPEPVDVALLPLVVEDPEP